MHTALPQSGKSGVCVVPIGHQIELHLEPAVGGQFRQVGEIVPIVRRLVRSEDQESLEASTMPGIEGVDREGRLLSRRIAEGDDQPTKTYQPQCGGQ